MIIYLHRPEGIVEVDSDTVTDEKLATFGVTREAFNELIPRDSLAEIDELKKNVEKLEKE